MVVDCWCQMVMSNIGLGNGVLPNGTEPSHDPILSYHRGIHLGTISLEMPMILIHGSYSKIAPYKIPKTFPGPSGLRYVWVTLLWSKHIGDIIQVLLEVQLAILQTLSETMMTHVTGWCLCHRNRCHDIRQVSASLVLIWWKLSKNSVEWTETFQTELLWSIEPLVNGPLTRYAKLRVAHAPGMPGTFTPPPRVSDPDTYHGTCVTHVPWCMTGSLTSGFLWSRRGGKRSRRSRRMHNP